MTKLTLPTTASLTKQLDGSWYIKWRDKKKNKLYREKLGLNRIKDLELRQRWADKILSFINNAYLTGKSVTPTDLEKFKIDSKVKSLKIEDIKSPFEDFIQKYLENIVFAVEPGTLKHRKTCFKNIKTFSHEVLNKPFLDFSDLDASFVAKFQKWAFDAPRKWSKNYCAKELSTLILLVNEAVSDGLVTLNPLWHSKKYKLKKTETDNVALSYAQVLALYKTDIEDAGVAKARDIFVFACLTGLRYSDFSTLKPSQFDFLKGKRVLVKKTTQKTKDKVIVPLHEICEEIEKKYHSDFQCFTNQTMNDYIKLACEKAGWTQKIQLKENIGGKDVLIDYLFFEVISCHTARRSFATISYLEWKMPIGLCMKITGHKTERQFLDYIKISKEQAALEMFNYIPKI